MKRGFIETQVERTAPAEAVGTIEAGTRPDYLTIPVVAKLDTDSSARRSTHWPGRSTGM